MLFDITIIASLYIILGFLAILMVRPARILKITVQKSNKNGKYEPKFESNASLNEQAVLVIVLWLFYPFYYFVLMRMGKKMMLEYLRDHPDA